MEISRIRDYIRKLHGVLSVDPLNPQIYEKVLELEERYTQSTGNINVGIMETLSREYQFSCLKTLISEDLLLQLY